MLRSGDVLKLRPTVRSVTEVRCYHEARVLAMLWLAREGAANQELGVEWLEHEHAKSLSDEVTQ